MEHPEDLGAVGQERPASVWQLDEMRQMVIDTNATTWAVFQCQYGGLTPKPTRFVSDIDDAKKAKYNKWPSFSRDGQYLGPLPYSCGHRWHVKKLIGKSKDGRFHTGPSAAYPAGLCMFLAQLMASVLRNGGGELRIGQVSKPNTALACTRPFLMPGCGTAGAAARASCHQHHHCQCSWALNKSKGWGGCFSFGGTVQYIEESNIYLCFVV